MAPADNTPDFDSMSPEEIMTWMETLAKRQGVKSEELTTSADVDIPIIDPDSVVIDEPGYVPYGEERPPKPASPPPVRQEPPMAAQSPRPTESPFPPPTQAPRPFAAPPPRPQAQQPEEQGPARPLSPLTPRPQAPPPSGLNPLRPPSTPPTRPMPTPPQRSTPDFTARPTTQPPTPNTQPSAPRQTSEFTPRPPVQPAAQNPPPAPRQTSEFIPRPPVQPAAQNPPSSPPPARPAPVPPPQNPRTAFEPPKWLTTRPLTAPLTPAAPPPPTQQPAWQQPKPPVESKSEPEPEKTVSGDADAMAWLESLAADQGDSMFNLDLSSLMGPPVVEEEPASSLDPVAWLQTLAGTQADDDTTSVFARIEPPTQPVATTPEPAQESAPAVSSADIPTVSDPFDSGVDPIAWLENLARRQGAKNEELTTTISMDIPVPENPVIDEPGYTPFSFDAPVERRAQRDDQPFTLDDPDTWPDLADGGAQPTAGAQADDVSAIERAISEGTVSPEQMQAYLEHQTDIYVDDLAHDVETVDEDTPPVPAELPDWLLEQVGAPPIDLPSSPATDSPADVGAFDDMPEWLREDANQADAVNFMGIFDDLPDEEDSEGLTTEPAFAGYTIEIDRNDPWVEAFEAEQEDGLPDITELPDWYVQNLNDPERVAAVEQMVGASALSEAALPQETELTLGQPVDLPSWVISQTSGADEPAIAADIPDWLLEIDAANIEPEEIPDWLNDNIDEDTGAEELFAPVAPAVVITPEPIRVLPPVQPKPEPVAAAPTQRPAASADLQTARTHADSGDVESSVASYEALIRINRELDSVVEDLTRLSKVHRSNPAVHRVLGDGLMRQGKLQAALDVYREALNQL